MKNVKMHRDTEREASDDVSNSHPQVERTERGEREKRTKAQFLQYHKFDQKSSALLVAPVSLKECRPESHEKP